MSSSKLNSCFGVGGSGGSLEGLVVYLGILLVVVRHFFVERVWVLHLPIFQFSVVELVCFQKIEPIDLLYYEVLARVVLIYMF